MRNVILLLPAILFVGAVASQITITGDDMPQPDVTYPLVTRPFWTSASAKSVEQMQWDASDLTALMDAPLTPVDINDASISAALVFNSPFNSVYQCDFYLPTELPDFGWTWASRWKGSIISTKLTVMPTPLQALG